MYKDRPLVCRLYPVGRAVDAEMNSYFFLTKTADYCKLGTGREYSIEEWLEEAQVEPYFQWNDRFNSFFMEMNHEKYRSLPLSHKSAFGEMLYEPDGIVKEIGGDINGTPGLSDDRILEIGYGLAKRFVERFTKQRSPG